MPVHIQKTNRIRIAKTTLYTSYDIIKEVRPLLFHLNMVWVPLKGKTDELYANLRNIARNPKYKDHFSRGSLSYLGVI